MRFDFGHEYNLRRACPSPSVSSPFKPVSTSVTDAQVRHAGAHKPPFGAELYYCCLSPKQARPGRPLTRAMPRSIVSPLRQSANETNRGGICGQSAAKSEVRRTRLHFLHVGYACAGTHGDSRFGADNVLLLARWTKPWFIVPPFPPPPLAPVPYRDSIGPTCVRLSLELH